MSLEQLITSAWYENKSWIKVLRPLNPLYRFGLEKKRAKAASQNKQLPVPVVVVGNITVGGTGKTPLIHRLTNLLSKQGVKVGIVSRGYGAKANQYPYQVSSQDSVNDVGDEPLMLAKALDDVPVVIDPDRFAAAQHLLSIHPEIQIIFSDDGMQHFGLPRDLEILVVDGQRELGNEQLLPSGPLREPLDRLKEVDFCLVNGDSKQLKSPALKYIQPGDFQLQPQAWIRLATGERVALESFEAGDRIIALAGIGNPARFYASLESLGIQARHYSLGDHKMATEEELRRLGIETPETQILMTSKDAVKYTDLVQRNDWKNVWSLEVGVSMEQTLEDNILNAIQNLIDT